MINIERLHQNVTTWLQTSRQRVLALMNDPLTVATKSNRNDLVTNVDRTNQQFLIGQIQAAYPDARIEGEEGKDQKTKSLDGLVFFVDPIDGTMNFVKEHNYFAIMIGVYVDGKPVYGAIMDVMHDTIIAGGHGFAMRANDTRLPALADEPLSAGLIGLNGPMHAHNRLAVADIGMASSGVRMIGSAGMTFADIAQGALIGYISYLQPWDVAAALAILGHAGVIFSRPDGSQLDLLTPGIVVAATPQAHQTIMTMMNDAATN